LIIFWQHKLFGVRSPEFGYNAASFASSFS
jgi:hypothetical protein